MNIKYDKEADVLYIQINNHKVIESDQNDKGVILDYDKDGQIVGIEIIRASTKIKNPEKVNYELV